MMKCVFDNHDSIAERREMSTPKSPCCLPQTRQSLPCWPSPPFVSKCLIGRTLWSICSSIFGPHRFFSLLFREKDGPCRHGRDAARSGGGKVRAQLLVSHSGGLGVDQDEGEDAGCGSVIDPGVHRAALDDDIAGLQMRHL